MIAELEIRKQLIQFLSDPNSLDEFEDWLVSRSWNMHVGSAEAAQHLASSIELLLAEYSGGHITFEALRNELVPYATDMTVVVPSGQGAVTITIASSTATLMPLPAWPPAVPAWGYLADTKSETECV